MGDGRELRWSLDLRSFCLGCLVPALLLALIWVWLGFEYGVVLLPVPTRSDGSSVVRSDLNVIGRAAGQFAQENAGTLPSSLDQLVAPDEEGRSYLRSLPLDPWRQPYVYERAQEDAAWLTSLGPDGHPGTEDDVVWVVRCELYWGAREATRAELERGRR